jgi:hypothetical protein
MMGATVLLPLQRQRCPASPLVWVVCTTGLDVSTVACLSRDDFAQRYAHEFGLPRHRSESGKISEKSTTGIAYESHRQGQQVTIVES